VAALKTVVSVGSTPLVGLEGIRPKVTVTILNPTAENYCPSVKVEWFQGFTSFQESDCLPFDQVDPKDRAFHWSRQSPVGFPSGEWDIRVELQQGKWRQIKTTRIHVGGDLGER
jgi:hypothetical protein